MLASVIAESVKIKYIAIIPNSSCHVWTIKSFEPILKNPDAHRLKGARMNGHRKTHHRTPLNIYLHIVRNAFFGFLLIAAALFIGMFGYHVFERMSWVDAFLNASMILSGMGPATTLVTTAGKLFAGFYALFSGLAFIAIVVIMLSPLIHTFFRKIHLESTRNNDVTAI